MSRKPILQIIVADKSLSLCIFAHEKRAREKGVGILPKKPRTFSRKSCDFPHKLWSFRPLWPPSLCRLNSVQPAFALHGTSLPDNRRHTPYLLYRMRAIIDRGTRQIDRAHALLYIGHPRLGPPAAVSRAARGFRPNATAAEARKSPPSPHPPTVHRL